MAGVVDDQHRQHVAPGRDALERGGDGGQGALVADHEVPVGVGVGGVPAAGAGDLQPVAGRGVGGPPPGEAHVAVDDEVEAEPAGVGVPGADRVAAADRLVLGGAAAGLLLVEGHRVGRARRDEEAFT